MANSLLNIPRISIISPVYNAAKILPELVSRIVSVCEQNKYDYEVILVDDHSPDNSWDILNSLCLQYPALSSYRLSRNFGQHYAITAAIGKASGDVIIIMDCDLQDNPIYIPELIQRYGEGFNVVCTIKQTKKYSWYRRIASDAFFFIINNLSDLKLEKNLGTFTLIDRKVADEFLKIKDYHRHTSLIFAWLGFKRGYVHVKHDPRFEGKSSYNLQKLLAHAINGVISQSDKILKWAISLGLILFMTSIVGVLYIIVKSFFVNFDAGWPSLFVTMIGSTGIILFMMGILGLYIGKIFEQVKERPLFIISEEAGKNVR
jgi:glycosyltransferase involved in cell wall biosynthesis